ncbi:helix-turn-helix domain-containing protein [Microbacterium sediminicola]|uniref:TetR/AcrR family transcriptional regulator n=1 Tax=Microbacterium sediminicola TaxID=415210 RepID=UPI0031DFAFBB
MTTASGTGRERTRERLLHAAYEVFAEVGPDAASVEAICERAGFTRGAFYSNFSTKDALFLDMMRVITEGKLASVTRNIEVMRTRGDVLMPAEIMQRILEGTIDDAPGVVLMSELRLRAMRDDDTAMAFRTWERDLHARVAGIVDVLVDTYGLRLRLPAEDVARVVLEVWEAALNTAVIDRLPYEQLQTLAATRAQKIAFTLVEFPEEPARPQ